MKYWLITDTHFNHLNLEKWGTRSGDWQEQLWKGLRNLSEFNQEDILIHLGDVCIGEDTQVHAMIMGSLIGVKKILVRGNHDGKSIQWYQEHGWDFVCDGFEMLYKGHYLHFTHRPARPQGNITYNIHGHTHGNLHRSEEYCDYYSPEYHIDICPEIVGFKPILLDHILPTKIFKSKKI